MQNIENLLKNPEIRLTTAREDVLRVLANAKKPLCYDEILSKTKVKMDKATLYRAITHFEEIGILIKLESNERKWYFELKDNKNHAHFICENCQQISCIDFFPEEIKSKKVTSIVIKGTCEKCNE